MCEKGTEYLHSIICDVFMCGKGRQNKCSNEYYISVFVGRSDQLLTLINTECVSEGEIYSLHQLILHVCLGKGQALIITVCVCVWDGDTE